MLADEDAGTLIGRLRALCALRALRALGGLLGGCGATLGATLGAVAVIVRSGKRG